MEKLKCQHGSSLLRPVVSKKFLSLSLLALLSMPLKAQDKFELSPKLTSKIIQDYQLGDITVFPVTMTKIDVPTHQSAYLVSGVSIDIMGISGTFEKMPEAYKVVIKDVEGRFVANQLITKLQNYESYDNLSNEYPLIRKVGTEEYYLIMSYDFVSSTIKEYEQSKVLNLVHKLGYKEFKVGDDYYIKSKTSEIKLNFQTYQELEKNPNYISTLDADQSKIANLVQQTVEHSTRLDKYLSQYRIQKHNLPTATINAWRTATTNAQKLMNQINKLSEKYDGDYSFKLLRGTKTIDMFSDTLLASKGVLGM